MSLCRSQAGLIMRLIKAGNDVFEVHHQGRKIGTVWYYDGKWRGETNAGTPVLTALNVSATSVGVEVEKLHMQGR